MKDKYIFGISALVLGSLFAIYYVVTLEKPATNQPKEQTEIDSDRKLNDKQQIKTSNAKSTKQSHDQPNKNINEQLDERATKQSDEKIYDHSNETPIIEPTGTSVTQSTEQSNEPLNKQPNQWLNKQGDERLDEQPSQEPNEIPIIEPTETPITQATEKLNEQNNEMTTEESEEQPSQQSNEQNEKIKEIHAIEEVIEDCIRKVSDYDKNEIEKKLIELKNKFENREPECRYNFTYYVNYLIQLIGEIATAKSFICEYITFSSDFVWLCCYQSQEEDPWSEFARSFCITFKYDTTKEVIVQEFTIKDLKSLQCGLRSDKIKLNEKEIKVEKFNIPKKFFVQFSMLWINVVEEGLIDNSFRINLPEFAIFGEEYKLTHIFVWKKVGDEEKWAFIGKGTFKSKNGFVKNPSDVLYSNISFGIFEKVVQE